MSVETFNKAIAEPGSITIMLVEPDILARLVLADYLRNCGYRVLESGQAQDVLAILESGGTIDVIVCELNLPDGMDGYNLASQIRQTYPSIDVIIPFGIANAAEKAEDLCKDGPGGKSFHPQEVVRRITMLRERRRTSKQTLG